MAVNRRNNFGTNLMTLQAPRRTGVSTLSDAELLLFDCAFNGVAGRRLFRHAVFPQQWNRTSHGLDDETLVKAFHRFETEGLITSEAFYNARGRPDRTVQLTEAGGALWESERLPDWNRFVTDMYPGNRVSIYGHTADTCDRYFQVACDAGLINYVGGRIRRAVAQRNLIYWRPVQPVYLLCAAVAKVQTSQFHCTDWSYFESQRSWWRFADEIGKFWHTEGNAELG